MQKVPVCDDWNITCFTTGTSCSFQYIGMRNSFCSNGLSHKFVWRSSLFVLSFRRVWRRNLKRWFHKFLLLLNSTARLFLLSGDSFPVFHLRTSLLKACCAFDVNAPACYCVQIKLNSSLVSSVQISFKLLLLFWMVLSFPAVPTKTSFLQMSFSSVKPMDNQAEVLLPIDNLV